MDFDLSQAICFLANRLLDDAIVATGAGQYLIWLHRFYGYRKLYKQIVLKGYGLPATITAKLRHLGRDVVCLAGRPSGTMLLNAGFALLA